ncbi:MAG: ferrous iron transport protein B [Chloroflexota bacterium]|nr:ferrous iron transport protein B [Chloroflexota bacterium]
MDISDISQWFWPALSFLLLILLLWTRFRQRKKAEPPESSTSRHARMEAEDALKAAYAQEKRVGVLRVEDLARTVGVSEAQAKQGMEALRDLGWVKEDEEGRLRLTKEGKVRAQDLIRAHRLWERYLVDREGMPLDAVHDEAHHREHSTTPEELERLDAELGYPAWDPHGHAIPAPKCGVPSSPGRPLWEAAESGDRFQIVCLDDDSPPLLAQLVALGLKPGVDTEVVDCQGDLVNVRVDSRVIPLASVAADHVFVVAAPALPLELGRLPVGARARVVEVKGGGKHQRRMLDMGFVPGAEVTVMRRASLGDPIEYRVKGTGWPCAARTRTASWWTRSRVDKGTITVGVAGNPNVGKSVIFNALTGSRQHVGNWPGKTVERAQGTFIHQGRDIRLVDLPGTYSLAAQSPEEVIARDYILSGKPDVVLDIVDATSLERNLNLALQIMELTDQVVIALNLMDEVKRGGWEIDVKRLAADLGVPVVPTVATEEQGLPELVETIVDVAEGRRQPDPAAVEYGVTVEGYIDTLQHDLRQIGIEDRSRWVAVKLLEDDPEIVEAFKQGDLTGLGLTVPSVPPEALQTILRQAVRMREEIRPDAKVEIIRRRYEFAHDVVHRVARRVRRDKESLTERIDRVVTHRIWSWPITVAVFLAVFWITIQGGEIAGEWLEAGLSWLTGIARAWLTRMQAPWWVTGALVDGLLVGLGTVVAVMLPPMTILFTVFALLEDVGLLPRVAFNLDRPMQALGSQGKQTLTWGMSFGCNVTGVMASRIIENKKVRLAAILTSPLIICSGGYGAGVALVIALFGDRALPVMLSLVVLSLGAASVATLVLNRTLFRGEPGGFVLEMPPYRKPKWGQVAWRALVDRVAHTMWRAVEFAGPASVLIWVLGNLPPGAPFEQTAVGWLVRTLAPLGRIFGLSGEMITALLFTLPAKEIVIPALAMTYGLQTTLVESERVLDTLPQIWGPLSSYTFVVFFMLYLPCLVTVWAIWKETRSLKWTLMGILVPLTTASVITFLVYQGGQLLGFQP